MSSSVLNCAWFGSIYCYTNQGFRSNYSEGRIVFAGKDKLLLRHQKTTTVRALSSPWLMLPPVFEGRDMFYNFHVSAEEPSKRVQKIRDGVDSDQVPPDEAKFVGSSHGWLALFDEDSNHVFLSNPISGRHIKLPTVQTLPDPEINLLDGRGSVSRVILSCSPDEDGDACRALMSFGPHRRLACCVPGASTEWTPVGCPYFTSSLVRCELSHSDFVYSSRDGMFFCVRELLVEFEGWNLEFEGWNLRELPLRPNKDWSFIGQDGHRPNLLHELRVYPWNPRDPWPEQRVDLEHIKHKCFHLSYLVLDERSDQLYHVVRHVTPRLRPDGSAAPRIFFMGKSNPNWDYRYPYQTVYFDVYKVDRSRKRLSYGEDSLDGLAMFVGMNHSCAVSAADFPHLKPGSIYFTDDDRLETPEWINFGGHDNGVFDYRDKALFSCTYYSFDYKKIKTVPPPMWFTPNLNLH